MRKSYTSAFKDSVALAAVREEGTFSELSSRFDVRSTLISKWKSHLFEQSSSLFVRGKHTGVPAHCEERSTLEVRGGCLGDGKDIHSLAEARTAVGRWITYYNQHRPTGIA